MYFLIRNILLDHFKFHDILSSMTAINWLGNVMDRAECIYSSWNRKMWLNSKTYLFQTRLWSVTAVWGQRLPLDQWYFQEYYWTWSNSDPALLLLVQPRCSLKHLMLDWLKNSTGKLISSSLKTSVTKDYCAPCKTCNMQRQRRSLHNDTTGRYHKMCLHINLQTMFKSMEVNAGTFIIIFVKQNNEKISRERY